MEKDKGYIKLFRKLGDNPISSNLELIGLFASFLLKANRDEKTLFFGNEKINLNPGEFVSSSIKLSQEYGISRGKFSRLLGELQKELILSSKGYSKYTIYKILNRSSYQESEQQKSSKKSSEWSTNKNIDNIIDIYIMIYKDTYNRIIDNIYIREDKLILKVLDFLEQRKQLKNEMTEKAIKIFLSKIIKFKTKYDDETIIEMINEAIERNRLTIYETNFKNKQKKKSSYEGEGRENFSFT